MTEDGGKPRGFTSTIGVGIAILLITGSALLLAYWATVLPGRTAPPPGQPQSDSPAQPPSD